MPSISQKSWQNIKSVALNPSICLPFSSFGHLPFELDDDINESSEPIMSIRVIARIRPQHESEIDKDVIVSANKAENAIKIPNPKNGTELYS